MRRTAENNTTTPQPLQSRDSGEHHNSADTPNTPTAPRSGNTSTGHKKQAPAISGVNPNTSTASPPNSDQSKQTTSSTKDASNPAGSNRDSTTAPITNVRSRRDRPCDACRRRKSRCVLNEGQTVCVLCCFHNQDCTFVQSPQPRRRKVPAEGAGGVDNKKDRDRERDARGRGGTDGHGAGQKDRERGSYSKKRFEIFSFASALFPLLSCNRDPRWGFHGGGGAGRCDGLVVSALVVRRISAASNSWSRQPITGLVVHYRAFRYPQIRQLATRYQGDLCNINRRIRVPYIERTTEDRWTKRHWVLWGRGGSQKIMKKRKMNIWMLS